jgi:SnoaL-like protein
MNLKSYLDYVAAFNAQDWDRVAGQFYAPDIEVSFPIATLSGRDQVLAWFAPAHEALFETLVPHGIEFSDGGRTVVADLSVQFILLDSTSYSPLREQGEAGDVVTVAMRARYRLNEDDLISSLTVEFTAPPRRDGKITADAVVPSR